MNISKTISALGVLSGVYLVVESVVMVFQGAFQHDVKAVIWSGAAAYVFVDCTLDSLSRLLNSEARK